MTAQFKFDEEQTLLEWQHVKLIIKNDKRTADNTMEWILTNLQLSHPNMFKILSIGLLLPTSTADCERGFSTLKRIKTEQMSTLSNPVLNSLLAITMQGPPPSEFDYHQAV